MKRFCSLCGLPTERVEHPVANGAFRRSRRMHTEELRGHVEKLVMTIENVVSCLSAGAEWRDVRMAHDDLEKSLTPAVREIAEQVRKGREEKDAEKTSTD